MTWRQLGVYVRHLPRESALVRELHGDHADWGLSEQLLALVVDVLRVANWQRTRDGEKGRRAPKPIPRPGVTDNKTQMGKTSRSPEEVKALLARNRRGELTKNPA